MNAKLRFFYQKAKAFVISIFIIIVIFVFNDNSPYLYE